MSGTAVGEPSLPAIVAPGQGPACGSGSPAPATSRNDVWACGPASLH
ncbi:MAG: hypothetical protein K1Y36_26410 [Blastocatellia bacterium]|nr:hypothetical protein [Blastocatellia bacterium]